MSMTLEQEFEQYKFIHKSSMVLGCLLKFYRDEEETGIKFPGNLYESPEDKAKKHYYELLADKNIFNETYEKCWEKYGALLP